MPGDLLVFLGDPFIVGAGLGDFLVRSGVGDFLVLADSGGVGDFLTRAGSGVGDLRVLEDSLELVDVFLGVELLGGRPRLAPEDCLDPAPPPPGGGCPCHCLAPEP